MHLVHAVSEGQKFAADHSLEVVTCPSCRIVYAIPASLVSSARAYPGGSPGGWTLCCPMGHEWHYTGKSVTEKLEEERRRVQATRDLLAAEERSHAATRGHLTRTKKRVSAGVCPCCNRTFQQLARHMTTQHPGYVEREPGQLPHDPEHRRAVPRARMDALLDFLGDGERRFMEITNHLGITTSQAGVLVHRMLKSGEITRVSWGLYRRAS